jgi:hypothetical protein
MYQSSATNMKSGPFTFRFNLIKGLLQNKDLLHQAIESLPEDHAERHFLERISTISLVPEETSLDVFLANEIDIFVETKPNLCCFSVFKCTDCRTVFHRFLDFFGF